MSSDTSKRDALFRTLYVRREYGQLAALSQQVLENAEAESAADEGTEAPTDDALELDSLRDVILLPPPGMALAASAPAAATPAPAQCWRGLLYVRHRPSPWYGAVLAFLVHLPERYPFECPTLLLEHNMRSHPLLGHRDSRGRSPSDGDDLPAAGVPLPFFEEVYCSVDPMRVSVMALVLRHLKLLFYPSAWPSWWTSGGGAAPPHPFPSGGHHHHQQQHTHPHISRMLARRDVKKHGLLHRGDVVLGRPYVDLLADSITQQLLELFAQDVRCAEVRRESAVGAAAAAVHAGRTTRRLREGDDSDAAVMRWSEWYGRVLLPQILALP